MLAALRRPARWVKRVVTGRLRVSSLEPISAAELRAAWPVFAALAADSNDEAAQHSYQVLRRRLCHTLLTCDAQTLRNLTADDVFHLVTAPVHKDIGLLPEERGFRKTIVTRLDAAIGRPDEHVRLLLAAALYFHAYDLDPRHLWAAIETIEPTLFPALFRYLLNLSINYTEVGEADRHAQFVESALARLAELPERRDVILAAFGRHYAGGMRLANRSSLKRFFVLERTIQTKLLNGTPQAVDLVPLPTFPSHDGRRRIGLLRQAFTHEFDFLIRPLSLLPSDQFEVHVFAVADEGQATAAQSYQEFRSHQLVPGNVTASVNVIRQAGIDILINGSPLGGDFQSLISGVLLTRSAPVQVLYCSDVVTSGIPAMDFIIVGDTYLRTGLADEFTERLVTCPGTGLYFPRGAAAAVDRETVRSELGVDPAETLYVSSAHLFKFTPELLRTWVRVLRDDPKGRLALMPVAAEYMTPYARRARRVIVDACADAGVFINRVSVLDARGREAVSRVLAAADVYLDSFPYSGPTSAIEALLAGVPVVTLAGDTYRGTFVAGVLRELSLDCCIAATVDEYADLARRLAHDAAFRSSACQQVAARLSQARFLDAGRVAQDLNQVLARLVPCTP